MFPTFMSDSFCSRPSFSSCFCHFRSCCLSLFVRIQPHMPHSPIVAATTAQAYVSGILPHSRNTRIICQLNQTKKAPTKISTRFNVPTFIAETIFFIFFFKIAISMPFLKTELFKEKSDCKANQGRHHISRHLLPHLPIPAFQ